MLKLTVTYEIGVSHYFKNKELYLFRLKEKLMKTDTKLSHIFYFVFGIAILMFMILQWSDKDLTDVINLTFLISLLALIGYIDFKTKTIPNELILFGLGFRVIMYIYCLVFTSIVMKPLLIDNLLAAFICAGVFFIGRILKMGAGDVKLYFMIGLFLGLSDSFNALFYAVLVMFVFSVIGLLTKKLNLKDEIAVAPFAFLGVLAMIIIGL
jgi:prepilin signal peptidase PulO-like enzyme (type II secretory pathway)